MSEDFPHALEQMTKNYENGTKTGATFEIKRQITLAIPPKA
jgi:hypothetical protein